MVDLKRWDGRIWESLLSAIPERSPDLQIEVGFWFDSVPRAGNTSVSLSAIKTRDTTRPTTLQRIVILQRRRFVVGEQPPARIGCTYGGQTISRAYDYRHDNVPWIPFVFTNPVSTTSGTVTFEAPSTIAAPGIECLFFAVWL